MQVKRMALLMSAAGLIGLGGCWKSVNTTERAFPEGQPTFVQDRRVQTDPDLKAQARIVDVRESVVSGDLTRIQVEIFNSWPWVERINYKFVWYDVDGMAVDTPTSQWKPVIIRGKETVSLTGIAPNPRAKDFRLMLQESRR